MSVADAGATWSARPRAAMSARRRASPGLFLLANAALAVCALAAGGAWLPGPLRMLGAALLVLVLPGAAWLGLFRKNALDAPRLALAAIGFSSVAAIGGLIALALGPEPPSRILLLAWTAVVMNAGLFVAGAPAPLDPRTPWKLLAAIAACGFLTTAASALWLVPPLEDHDMEVRGTAYGLATTLKPYFLTNREVYLPFAHPILFHVHVAESLVMTGEIGATKPSYDSARRAEVLARAGKPVPWMDWWQADYHAFVENPAKAGTRAPSALFAALVLALLADLVRRLTGDWRAGLAAAALYATVPEIVVRSAYAGYFGQTVFAMLAAACLFDGGGKTRNKDRADLGWLAAAGAFAALVDHKTVVLILGVGGLAAARVLIAGWEGGNGARLRPPLSSRGKSGRPPGRLALRAAAVLASVDKRVIALGAGFGTATLAWWAYGLSIDPSVFVRDHLRMHIAHRLLLNDVRLAHDANRYAPSMAELWMQFCAHTGYFLLPVALAGIVLWLFTRGADDRRAALAAWCICGAVLYTLTDWRQTKHLMNGLAPMTAAAVCLAWPKRARDRAEDGAVEGTGGIVPFADGPDGETRLHAAASSGGCSREEPGIHGPNDDPVAPRRGVAPRPGVAPRRGIPPRRGVALARSVAALALAAAALVNLVTDVRLVQDFGSLKVSGASDVDGW